MHLYEISNPLNHETAAQNWDLDSCTTRTPIYSPLDLLYIPHITSLLLLLSFFFTSLSISLRAGMACFTVMSATLLVFVVLSSLELCSGARKLASLYQPPTTPMSYHKGDLLDGDLSLSILWYGKFTAAQKSIVSDFINSLTPSPLMEKGFKITSPRKPLVSDWWKTVQKYSFMAKRKGTHITLSDQVSDESYSLGKSLKRSQISEAARRSGGKAGLVLVLTDADVVVEGFCMSSCGTHASAFPKNSARKSAYIWVGNSATQCPGQCAWPFHQPMYGPQGPPAVAPSGDVGVDGMIVNIASLLAGAVTNPFGGGYFQGPAEAPLEAVSACAGIYGKGAYPGYAGDVLVDPITGASYNAQGVNGRRKYLLPAVFDPSTSACSTLV